MRHVIGLALAGLMLLVVAKGFFGSFWRKPPSREDPKATDWSSYSGSESTNHDPSDHSGHS
jgi:hypothetical protein